jgi:hypothetical protein
MMQMDDVLRLLSCQVVCLRHIRFLLIVFFKYLRDKNIMSFRPLLPLTCLAVASCPAFAGVELYTADVKIYSTPNQEANVVAGTYGAITADVTTGTFGSVTSTNTTAATSITMDSAMAINGGIDGEAKASALYDFNQSVLLTVTWNWTKTNRVGSWSVQNVGGAVAHSLAFNAGVFNSVGGDFGQTPSGTSTFVLAAGNYKFNSDYLANSMPAQSRVQFTWGAIPAPGALAAFAIMGLNGRRRRGN